VIHSSLLLRSHGCICVESRAVSSFTIIEAARWGAILASILRQAAGDDHH
jgi:hypothetical protein